MLSRVLTSILFLEVLLYGGHAVAQVVRGEWAPWFAIVFMLGMPVVVRGLVVLASFVVSWFWRSPRPESGKIGLIAGLMLFLREWRAAAFQYGIGQAFESVFMPPDRLPHVARDEAPVLLVHGYCCNRGVWWWMKPRLERAGHVVATVSLEPVYGDIDDYALPLSDRIEAVCRESGATRVSLVCHSMGGLSARAYLRACGSDRVARLITIGTPHHGSEISRLGMGRNARQMQPGGDWLQALQAVPLAAGVQVISIYSLHDNLVAPQDSAMLEGAQLVPLAGQGHLDMLASQSVLDRVCDALGDPAQAPGARTVRSRFPASVG